MRVAPFPTIVACGVFPAAQLLVALILLIVFSPLVEHFENGDLIESFLVSLVLGAAALLVGGHRRMLVVNICLAVPAVVGRWLHHAWPQVFHGHIALGMALVFSAFAAANILRFIMRAPRVDSEVLCAALACYLLLGLIWAFAYMLVVSFDGQAFTYAEGGSASGWSLDGFSAFYFSYCTLSTVGYGDIAPLSRVARMLAAVEAMTGMLYVGTLIARLVALYSREEPTKSSPEP